MSNPFLSLAKQGKNTWWRYVAAIFIILFFYLILGSIPTFMLGAMLAMDSHPETHLNTKTFEFEGVDPLIPYLGLKGYYLVLLIGIWIGIYGLHRRQLITLITPHNHVNWRRILQAFSIYFGLILITGFGFGFLLEDNVEVTFNLNQFLIFFPIALILTPLQTTLEELLFRGYLMQAMALNTSGPWIPVLGSSALFMLAHYSNPEMSLGWLVALIYFLYGVFLAFITVKSQSLELALGVHAANNLFVVLVLNSVNSSIPSPSIFTNAAPINPPLILISLIVKASIFCLIIFRRK